MAIVVRDLPPSPMPDASSVNSQAAADALAAQIVADARGGVAYGQGYDGRGSGMIIPDLRDRTDGAWLANMAPGRPIDLGPTAGWSGFGGRGQFVGFPSGMPHVLYGGYMDTLAPYMQSLAPFLAAAMQAPAVQAPARSTGTSGSAGSAKKATPAKEATTAATTPVQQVQPDVLGALALESQGVSPYVPDASDNMLQRFMAWLAPSVPQVVNAEVVPQQALSAAETPRALPSGAQALPSGGVSTQLPPSAGGTATPVSPTPRTPLSGGGAVAALPPAEAPKTVSIQQPVEQLRQDILNKIRQIAPFGVFSDMMRGFTPKFRGLYSTQDLSEYMQKFDEQLNKRLNRPTSVK